MVRDASAKVRWLPSPDTGPKALDDVPEHATRHDLIFDVRGSAAVCPGTATTGAGSGPVVVGAASSSTARPVGQLDCRVCGQNFSAPWIVLAGSRCPSPPLSGTLNIGVCKV